MAAARITVTGSVAEVSTPFDPTVVELLRSIPGRRWDAGRRVWVIPAHYVEQVTADLEDLGYRVIVHGQSARREPPRSERPRDTRTWIDHLYDAVGPERVEPVTKALLRVLHPDLSTGDTALTQQLLAARERRGATR